MTDPKLKADKEAGMLSETTKTHLLEVYIKEKYNREPDISNKYIQKGLEVEEDSITLYTRVKKTFFVKNETLLKNDYICGTPDLFLGENVQSASHIIDIKSSWDIFTFLKAKTKSVNTDYWWQLQGYMALTGADSSTLAYCLVDTPEQMLLDEKRKLFYKMNAGTEENPEYIMAAEKLELLAKYDDIPMVNRVFEFRIDRDENAINRIYEKVIRAWEYLSTLDL